MSVTNPSVNPAAEAAADMAELEELEKEVPPLEKKVKRRHALWVATKVTAFVALVSGALFTTLIPFAVFLFSLWNMFHGWGEIVDGHMTVGSLQVLWGAFGVIIALAPLAVVQNVMDFTTKVFDKVEWLKFLRDDTPKQITTVGRMVSMWAALIVGLTANLPVAFSETEAFTWWHLILSMTLALVFYIFGMREAGKTDEIKERLAGSSRLVGSLVSVAMAVLVIAAFLSPTGVQGALDATRSWILDQRLLAVLLAVIVGLVIHAARHATETKGMVFSIIGAVVASVFALVVWLGGNDNDYLTGSVEIVQAPAVQIVNVPPPVKVVAARAPVRSQNKQKELDKIRREFDSELAAINAD